MRGGLTALVVGLSATVVAAASAHISRVSSAPLQVQSASLEQSGQNVTWSLQMGAPFSPGGLRAAGRSVCLLIEGIRDHETAGQLCVTGPSAGGRTARLEYRPVLGAGTGQLGPSSLIAASVTRPGSRQLTATFVPAAIGVTYTAVRWQVRSAVAPTRCVASAGTACTALYPALPALARLHTPRAVSCTDAGPPFVAGTATTRRQIALTFDDGPWYQTPQFVSLLEHDSVPATFFEVGEHISEFGEGGAIERRMLADGDMIGDHTWSHVDVAGAGSRAAGQIEDTAVAVRKATDGFTPCLFRAPGGSVSSPLIAEARSLGFTTIQWDIDPRDWARPGVREIESNVLANAHPGAIVIMHDGGGDRSQTLAALPDIIATLRARGYTFVTVTQLLGERVIYR
ncbi:MAG: polysaccharide deacetylase family protein [Solirubrobacteraceae bacterium]